MDLRRKSLKEIVAANVDVLVAATNTSEAQIANRGYAPQKNVNNARNAVNITLDKENSVRCRRANASLLTL